MTCPSHSSLLLFKFLVKYFFVLLYLNNLNPNIQGPPHALTVIHSPRLSGSLLLSLTCCSPPSLLCGRNSGRLWGRSRGTTNIVIPQVILTFGLGQSNVNLLCVYMGMWNYSPPSCCKSGWLGDTSLSTFTLHALSRCFVAGAFGYG